MNIDLSDVDNFQDNPLHAFILSVDLGRQQDHTALAIAEMRPVSRRNTRGKRYITMGIAVHDLERLPLGMPYDEIQQVIHDEFWDPTWWMVHPKTGRKINPQLVIDSGGPGWPVVDNLSRGMGLHPYLMSYALTRGSSTPRRISRNRFTVPRSTVFQQLYAAASSELVGVDPRIEHAKTLTEELKNLQVEPSSEEGYEKVVHRSGTHDDLSIATGIAVYLANETLKRRKGSRVKIMDYSKSAEIDVNTGTFKRRGQQLRSRPRGR